jgi:fatty acid desaturase
MTWSASASIKRLEHVRQCLTDDVLATAGAQCTKQLGQGRLIEGHRGESPWCEPWSEHTGLHAMAPRLATPLAGALSSKSTWWVGKHNRHHSNPNHTDLDPDVTIGVLAFTAAQASDKRGLVRAAVRFQAYLFFPLLLLEAGHLHAASIKAVLGGRERLDRVEALLLLVHAGAYVAALLLVLSPLRAAAFLLLQQGLFGLYLGCCFAPNHKGMPILEEGKEPDYLRRQVLTSRNVRGSRMVDFLMGGLNYQIEHHLFPSMPRPNLRRAQPLVRAFCTERGVSYSESSVFGAYGEALRHLHQASVPLRPAVADADTD